MTSNYERRQRALDAASLRAAAASAKSQKVDRVRADARFNEAVDEMRRMADVMLISNKKYLSRERQVRDKHAEGSQNYSGDIGTVLNNDILLKQYSGTTRAAAELVSGLSAFIQAELALRARRSIIGSLSIQGIGGSL